MYLAAEQIAWTVTLRGIMITGDETSNSISLLLLLKWSLLALLVMKMDVQQRGKERHIFDADGTSEHGDED